MCHFISETMFCNHCFAALGGEQRAKWKDDICSGNKASVLPAQHVCEDVTPLPGLLHEKFNFSPQWICYAQDPNGTTIHFQGPSLKSDLASRQKYSNRDFIRSHVSLLLITYTMLHFICIFFFPNTLEQKCSSRWRYSRHLVTWRMLLHFDKFSTTVTGQYQFLKLNFPSYESGSFSEEERNSVFTTLRVCILQTRQCVSGVTSPVCAEPAKHLFPVLMSPFDFSLSVLLQEQQSNCGKKN